MKVGNKVKVFQGEQFEGNATVAEVHRFDDGSIDTWYTDVNFDADDSAVIFSRFVRERDLIT